MRAALLLVLVGVGVAAQELRVVGPEPAVVRLGGKSVVVLTVLGAEGDVALGRLPLVEGLEIIAGRPTPTISQTTVSGRVATLRGIAWTIELEPRRAGRFELPPLRIEAGPLTLTSGALRLEAIRDGAGEAYAFVETEVPRSTWLVGEVIPVRLRIGIDREFASSRLISPYRQRLDLPVQLQASWITELSAAEVPISASREGSGDPARCRFVLNDAPALADPLEDRLRAGRRFRVVEIERRIVAETPGELVIPESLLRFAYATEFRDDFIRGRVPVNRHDAVVVGARRVLRIEEPPGAGRPPDFSGAVGRFAVRAEARPQEVRVGESFRLVLHIEAEGEGSLERFVPPPLDRLRGFHVQGVAVQGEGARRTVTYDLAPRSTSVREVPPIALTSYDPTPPAGYRRVRTAAVPLEVIAVPEGSGDVAGIPSAASVPGRDDIFEVHGAARRTRRSASRRLSPALLGSALLAPWVLALGLAIGLGIRDRDRRDPARRRARRAASVFRRRLRSTDALLDDALAEYLAARLGCSRAAIVDPDLPTRLESAGVEGELADRAATLLASLVAGRYGGAVPEEGSRAAQQIVEALEARFRTREASR